MAEDQAGLHARRRVSPEKVQIFPCADPAFLARLKIHPELNVFRPPDRQHQALVGIAKDEDGCVTVAVDGDTLVGYAAFHRPDPFERWGKDETGGIYELGAVEVAPSYRGLGLAKKLLEASFATGRFDDKLVIATLYYWHYDLERTGLTPFKYRDLLVNLYGSVGFTPTTTNDPDIFAYPENALMVRVGPRTPEKVRQSFEKLRFLPDEGPWANF